MMIRYTSKALGRNMSANFGASGGIAPYTFSIVPGSLGGSINVSTGRYTAPDKSGSEVIQATDVDGQTAQLTIMVGTALELVCDVIKQEMDLGNDQVFLWDQKINIPNDERLYIALGEPSCKPFGNSNKFVDGNSVQSTNFMATLNIDVLSRSFDAVSRKEEIIMALNSNYAESQQALNSFRIFPISQSFVNLSELEGSAIPYRFNIGVNIQYFVTKVKPVDYFDTFDKVSVTTES